MGDVSEDGAEAYRMLPNQEPPAGWPRPRPTVTRIVSLAGFALLTVIAAAVLVSAVTTGDVARSVVLAFVTLMFGHLVGLIVSMLRRPAPAAGPPAAGVTDQGERGLAFRYSRWAYYWLGAVLVTVVLSLAGFAVVLAVAGSVGGGVFAVVFVAGAVFLARFLLVMLRLAPGVVVVTPTGIYHRGLAHEHFVPWEGVVEVVARPGPTPWITVRAVPADGARQRRHTGRIGAGAQFLPFMVIRTSWLGANAVPAYEALTYYFANPGERPRLA
ncbi:hypothetical protein [Paractinoplanes globisporus]|uniref:PH domain-containing protein n=1 Tax=Paractinoplanes globisporus TaxID=113565 RepID=A0ABW6W871_9ACTN|nr:hypothetical protein [Actinoplanes globisporus]